MLVSGMYYQVEAFLAGFFGQTVVMRSFPTAYPRNLMSCTDLVGARSTSQSAIETLYLLNRTLNLYRIFSSFTGCDLKG